MHQAVVARRVDPLSSQVVSVTRFSTGNNAYNVIPDTVRLGGTYRSLTHDGMVRMKEDFTQVGSCKAILHMKAQTPMHFMSIGCAETGVMPPAIDAPLSAAVCYHLPILSSSSFVVTGHQGCCTCCIPPMTFTWSMS